jgi:hypothetical protein
MEDFEAAVEESVEAHRRIGVASLIETNDPRPPTTISPDFRPRPVRSSGTLS